MPTQQQYSSFLAGVILGAMALLAIVQIFFGKGCGNGSTVHGISLSNAANDSIRYYKDAYGKTVAETKVIMASRSELEQINANQSLELSKLKELVDKKTISVTVASTATSDKGTSTVVITKLDTVYKDSSIEIFPTYRSEWKEQWSKGVIVAGKDSVTRDITTYNLFSFSHKWKRDGFLKKKYAIVDVVDENPTTEVLGLKSYIVEPKKSVGIKAGVVLVGVGFLAGKILFGK